MHAFVLEWSTLTDKRMHSLMVVGHYLQSVIRRRNRFTRAYQPVRTMVVAMTSRIDIRIGQK